MARVTCSGTTGEGADDVFHGDKEGICRSRVLVLVRLRARKIITSTSDGALKIADISSSKTEGAHFRRPINE